MVRPQGKAVWPKEERGTDTTRADPEDATASERSRTQAAQRGSPGGKPVETESGSAAAWGRGKWGGGHGVTAGGAGVSFRGDEHVLEPAVVAAQL